MSADITQVRSGLPRRPGAEPWPPNGRPGQPIVQAEAGAAPEAVAAPPAVPVESASAATPVEVSAAPGTPVGFRRGLPRQQGGEPWPPADVAPHAVVAAAPAQSAPSLTAPAQSAPSPAPQSAAAPAAAPLSAAHASNAEPADAVAPAANGADASVSLVRRRGLPRVAGGDAWPVVALTSSEAVDPAAAKAQQPELASAASEQTVAAPATPAQAAPASAAPAQATPAQAAPAQTTPAQKAPQPAVSTAAAAAPQPSTPKAAVAKTPASPAREPRMIGSRTLAQWIRLATLSAVGAIVAAGVIVLAARGVTTLPGVPQFLERYPGEYHPPLPVAEGFPAWARWSHFLNFFFMVLIIRTGLLVRYQQKPPAFYAPKKGGKKISLYLWLHTSIDVLWLLNGVIFVVLLLVTGHWIRVVPTSWEVFPNALSAGLQYLTLDWPIENGWVNYNSLQQLMYFTVIFIAAPLAALSGVRMSEWWPEKAKRLNKIYPAPLARAVHYPVMLFFVLFVIVHVFLVLATGALRNLNHMFAGTDQVSWVGFWWFAAALFAATAATWLARPLVLAPIANLFGRVSNR